MPMTRDELQPLTRCRFGVAVRDITAPPGIYARFWGAAQHDLADGVHRPATATAMVFAPLDGDCPSLALVALDYASFHPLSDEREVRDGVRQRTSFGEAELLLSLSHVHSGANASSARTEKPGGHLNNEYRRTMMERISEAVDEAKSNLAPAWISWGSGRCSLARNRDLWDDVDQVWGCGFNPDAEADDTVIVGRVSGDDGTIRAILFNYACHPTTLAWDNHLLSPDYIGAAREVLQNIYGAPAAFMQGASGDLGPRVGFVGDTAVADQNGRQLGYAVASAIEALDPPGTAFSYTGLVSSGADIATWAHRPRREDELAAARMLAAEQVSVELTPKEFPSGEELRRQLAETTDRALSERLERKLVLRQDLGEGERFSMPLWLWRLGEAAVVAIPNEPYSVLQQELRRAFSGNAVLVLGVTNGTLGYLVPRALYDSGRYQAWQSPFQPGCLEQVREAAEQGLGRLLGAAAALETGAGE